MGKSREKYIPKAETRGWRRTSWQAKTKLSRRRVYAIPLQANKSIPDRSILDFNTYAYTHNFGIFRIRETREEDEESLIQAHANSCFRIIEFEAFFDFDLHVSNVTSNYTLFYPIVMFHVESVLSRFQFRNKNPTRMTKYYTLVWLCHVRLLDSWAYYWDSTREIATGRY